MKERQEKDRVSRQEALFLFRDADLLGLGMWADIIRKALHPEEICTFVVDRNINYTNVCVNKCTFCAFWRDPDDAEAYILSKEDLFRKIEETLELGGTQILLQGGLHPDLGIDFYTDLLWSIKENFTINIHGF